MDPQNRANLWEHIIRLRERARHHDRAHHALPRGGRHDGRAGHRDRPRADHRRRHAGAAQGRAGRRPGPSHGPRRPTCRPRAQVAERTAATLTQASVRTACVWRPGRGRQPRAARRCWPRLADRGVEVIAATLHQPTLDDVFLNLTGRSLREAETGGRSMTATAPPTAGPRRPRPAPTSAGLAPRDADDRPRPVLAGLLAAAAAGLPGPVRPAAHRRRRRDGRDRAPPCSSSCRASS